jgi:hypothetical protein
MKKEYAILAVIITAAVFGPCGFFAGSLLTRPDRAKLARTIDGYLKNEIRLTERCVGSEAKLEQCQSTVNDLEVKNLNLKNGLAESLAARLHFKISAIGA